MPTKHVSANSKKKGWKDVQSKVKRNKRTKLAFIVLGLVAGLLILSWAIRFTQSLFTPWELSGSYQRTFLWNGEFNLNLLIKDEHISLLSYNPEEKKMIIINLPDEIFLEVPYGFGKWQLRAIYDLGQSQRLIGGDKLLVESVSEFLAVPIDGFLDLGSLKQKKSTLEVIEALRKNPFSGFNVLFSIRTNLTAWELLRLKMGMTGVRFDKVKEINLSQLNILEEEKLPDGTEVYTADPVKLDSVLTVLVDPLISAEHKSVAVFNATDRPQLAQEAARLIINLGGNVIITANAKERLKKTEVQGEKSVTLKRIRQIFTISDKMSSSSADIASRAEVNLFLGEDFKDEL